ENGIWLCQNCAKLVDNDPVRYSEACLRGWKRQAEDRALGEIGQTRREGRQVKQTSERRGRRNPDLKNLIAEGGQGKRPMKSGSENHTSADRGGVAYGDNASGNMAVTGGVGGDVVVNHKYVYGAQAPPGTVLDHKARIEYDAALRLRKAALGVR